MEVLKVGKFESILDGVEARLGGRPAPDVLSIDWQAVSPTRHIVILKGISPDRDVHIRLEAVMGGVGKLTMGVYHPGVPADTFAWECEYIRRVDITNMILALSPVIM